MTDSKVGPILSLVRATYTRLGGLVRVCGRRLEHNAPSEGESDPERLRSATLAGRPLGAGAMRPEWETTLQRRLAAKRGGRLKRRVAAVCASARLA
jgi:hypothetical protein